jgi:hypothetical protein
VLDNHDQNSLAVLRELGDRKERELKAQIEKEEIQRAIKTTDATELGALAVQKKRELEKLANEREAVRIKERQMADEIAQMESQILDQERKFQ